MSNLVNHANRELDRLGWPSEPRPEEGDFDYEYMIRKSAVDLVQLFADQHHSGMSAGMVLGMVQKLMNFEPLSPITDDPEDWIEVTDGMWQNSRDSRCFSYDGGKTYHNIDEKRKYMYRFVQRFPARFVSWVWNNQRWVVYPIHQSEAARLDNAQPVA